MLTIRRHHLRAVERGRSHDVGPWTFADTAADNFRSAAKGALRID
jgi:hypothetical protein